MRKIDPFSLKRPKRIPEEVAIESASNPGTRIVLKLRALDAVDAVNLASKVEELCRMHIEDGIPFYPVDGEAIQPTRELFSLACTLWAMQAGDEEERYTPEEFVAILAVAPESFSTLMDAVNRINSKGPLGAALGGSANPTGVRATQDSAVAENSATESSGP